jgi:hypothetical protein
LGFFVLLDDGDEKLLFGPEVVDEHPVAGPERLGQSAEAEVADAMDRDVSDCSSEKLFARVGPGHLPVSVPSGTSGARLGCRRWNVSNQIRISASSRSEASRHDVYRLLSDSATWSRWSPFSSVTLIEPAAGGGEGPGAVKETRYWGMTGHERVLSATPDRQMSYAYLKGALAPYMRDYVAVIDLKDAEDGTGTEILWHSTFRARFPGSGLLPRAILKRFLQRCADGLAEQAGVLGRKGSTPDG